MRQASFLYHITHRDTFILQDDGSTELDYFMAKVNIGYFNSLKDDTGQPLNITPIDLMDTVKDADNEVGCVICCRGSPVKVISVGMIISKIGMQI